MSLLERCSVLIAVSGLVLGHLAWSGLPAAEETSTPAEKKPVRTDPYGDPLPPSAVARLGTIRLQHAEQVDCLAFSPDDKILASGGNRTVRLWEVATSKQLLKIEWEKQNWARCIAFSSDGKTLAVGTGEKILFWETATGRPIPKEKDEIYAECLAFSPDGRILATGAGNIVYLWDVTTGNRLARLPGHRSAVQHIAFSPDGKFLASASAGDADDAVRLWDVRTGNELHAFSTDKWGAAGIAFSSDGKTLVSASRRKQIHLWDVATGKPLTRVLGADWLVALSPDGTRVLAEGAAGAPLELWDANSAKELCKLEGHETRIHRVAFSRESKYLASTAGRGGTVRIWNLTTGTEVSQHQGHESPIKAIAYSKDGKTLITGSMGVVRVWDVTTGRVLHKIRGEEEYFAFSPESKTLAWGNGSRGISLWDVGTGKQVGTVPQRELFTLAALSSDGTRLASALDRLQTINVWDIPSGKIVLKIKGAMGEVTALTFSHDGKLLAFAGKSGTIFLWDLVTGTEVSQVAVPKDDQQTAVIRSLVSSPNSQTLISAGTCTDFWALPSGKHLFRLRQHARELSPDGRILAVRSPVGTAGLLEIASGEEICSLPSPHPYPGPLAYAPDGKTLALACKDNSVLILDLPELLGVESSIPAQGLGRARSDQLWTDLADKHPTRAYRAVYTLALWPKETIPLVRERLRPAPARDVQRINQLIADLDSNQFGVRETASRELEKLYEVTEPELSKVLRSNQSPEVQRRIQDLLAALRRHPLPQERLREIRALRVLEQIGSPEARMILESLAQGEPLARLTQDAQSTLQRVNCRLTDR